MKTDALIQKRFQELSDKATTLNNMTQDDFGNAIVEPHLFQEWTTSAASLLERVFGMESVHSRNFERYYSEATGSESDRGRLLGIFRAAKADFEGGYLFKLQSLVSAEVAVDVLDQAQQLLAAQYKDPACIVTGVALETALKKLCDSAGIPQSKMDKMNADLTKAQIYNAGVQKQITSWAHWRNEAAHGNWNTYSEAEVRDMINGVRRFVADYL
jgi:hypothetical protein